MEGDSLGFISLDGITEVPIEINCKLGMSGCVEKKYDILTPFEMYIKIVSLARIAYIL
jgi:hypothetical protein